MAQDALRILLVEDSRTYASTLEALLKTKCAVPVEVFHKSFAKHAVSFLKERAGAVDLILLDLGLPDTSSDEESFTKIRIAASGIPLVVLTGRHDPDFSEHLLAEGASAYVNKDQISENPGILIESISALRSAGTATI